MKDRFKIKCNLCGAKLPDKVGMVTHAAFLHNFNMDYTEGSWTNNTYHRTKKYEKS